MASGKLVLLFVAVSLVAGLGLAGMTTHAVRSFRAEHGQAAPLREAAADPGYETGEPETRSWLEERFAELDVPAWPFGPSQWQDNSPPADRSQAYAPPDYDQVPYGYERDDYGRYEDNGDNYADGEAYVPGLTGDQRFEPGSPEEPAPWRSDPQTRQNETAADRAADAAARAGEAAQDVIAAERTGM